MEATIRNTRYAGKPGKPMLVKNCAVPGSVKTNSLSSAWAIHVTPRLTRSRATPQAAGENWCGTEVIGQGWEWMTSPL